MVTPAPDDTLITAAPETQDMGSLAPMLISHCLSELSAQQLFDNIGQVLSQFAANICFRVAVLDEEQNNVVWQADYSPTVSGLTTTLTTPTLYAGDDALMKLLGKQRNQPINAPTQTQSVCMPPKHPVKSYQQAIVMPLSLETPSGPKLLGSLSYGQPTAKRNTTLTQLVKIAAPLMAIAVNNTQRYEQAKTQASTQTVLNTISQGIRNSLDTATILQTTADSLKETLGTHQCEIHHYSRHEQNKAWQFERQLFDQRQAGPEQYNPFVINDCTGFKPLQQHPGLQHIKSFALFPILADTLEGQQLLLGTIRLEHTQPHAWQAFERSLIESVAQQLAVALKQAELYETATEQQQALTHALQELKTAQVQLIQSEKMAVLGQFVAGIAHDVNTPLGIINSNEQMISRCLQKVTLPANQADLQQTMTELLTVNHQAIERIMDIVHNLRNFARLDESDQKTVSVHEGINATLRLLKNRLEEEGITVSTQFGNLPAISCYPGLLNQVFQNLIVNAMQAMAGKPEPRALQISTALNNNMIEISVSDTGSGIAQEQLNKVFDPGFTTKGVGVGTGLGLAICYNIVQKHGGYINIASQVAPAPNHGTTVIISLPVKV